MSHQPETRFKRRVLLDLAQIPTVWVLKTQERARRGVPDLLICWRGRFIAIELKVDGEKPDALQFAVLERIGKAGGVATWTSPSTWANDFETLKMLFGGNDEYPGPTDQGE